MSNYFISTNNEVLLDKFMGLLIEEIILEEGIDTSSLSPEEKTDLGTKLTQEWVSNKSFMEQQDILFEKFATEEQKSEYDNWKLSEDL